MDFKTRKEYYNRCKPFEALAPGDERLVEIDRVGAARVRGGDWVNRLASRIELAEAPTLILFTGLPGSGKSTELQRLGARLATPTGANLLPVIIDAHQTIDLASPVDVPDVVAVIVHHVERAVLQLEGKDPNQALADSYLDQLWNWVSTTDVDLARAESNVPMGPNLVAELKTRPTLRAQFRRFAADHITKFLGDARKAMSALNERTRDLERSGVVVIFDSLEQLRGTSKNWTDVLDSAERIFADGAPHLRLPVHVLYTIPAALISRRFERVEFLPMIRLRTRAGDVFEDGVEAAREIVRRRVPDEILRQRLGADFEERVSRLIAMSGGYPREILHLLQSLFMLGETPLSDSDLRHLLGEVRDGYRKVVPADAFDWLATVAVDHYYTLESESHRQSADLMLTNNAVLRYLNDSDWFDLHPAVAEIPGVVEAVTRLRAQRAGL